MFWMLHDCGVPVKHLVEPFAGHGDYVTTWRGRPGHGGGSKVGLPHGDYERLWGQLCCKCPAAHMLRPALLRGEMTRERTCRLSREICC